MVPIFKEIWRNFIKKFSGWELDPHQNEAASGTLTEEIKCLRRPFWPCPVVHDVEEGVNVLCDLVLWKAVGAEDGAGGLGGGGGAQAGRQLLLGPQRQVRLHVLLQRVQRVPDTTEF